MKIGLLFAGQGAQYPGMGKDLYVRSAAARKIFDEAGEEIKGWCFEGSKETLHHTQITQPCIYTVTMAAYEALLEKIPEQMLQDKTHTLESKGRALKAAALAGFSLGEYAALTVGGSISDFAQGLAIVQKRGQIMGDVKGGAMAASMGSRENTLRCVQMAKSRGILEAANFNSPVQTVVAGEEAAVDYFMENARSFGVKAVKLSVGSAFHSPLMKGASVEFGEYLNSNIKLNTLSIPTYSNVTAGDISGMPPEKLAEIMSRQIHMPVYWDKIIVNMIEAGVDTMIEIGPGKTLCSLAGKISKDIKLLNVEDTESLERTVNHVNR